MGGTALNLFVFDVPSLSVDIDLNYVGAESREAMLDERARLEEALQAVFGPRTVGHVFRWEPRPLLTTPSRSESSVPQALFQIGLTSSASTQFRSCRCWSNGDQRPTLDRCPRGLEQPLRFP